jgi:hypothetical protein
MGGNLSPTTTPEKRRTNSLGGTISRVGIDVSGDPYMDLEREAALMLMLE